MTKYRCPTCKRNYASPVRLSESPICSGKRVKHSPTTMTEQPRG